MVSGVWDITGSRAHVAHMTPSISAHETQGGGYTKHTVNHLYSVHTLNDQWVQCVSLLVSLTPYTVTWHRRRVTSQLVWHNTCRSYGARHATRNFCDVCGWNQLKLADSPYIQSIWPSRLCATFVLHIACHVNTVTADFTVLPWNTQPSFGSLYFKTQKTASWSLQPRLAVLRERQRVTPNIRHIKLSHKWRSTARSSWQLFWFFARTLIFFHFSSSTCWHFPIVTVRQAHLLPTILPTLIAKFDNKRQQLV